MKVLKRVVIGVVSLVVVIALAVVIYLQTTKPTYQGELVLQGLQQPVEVLYDSYGVPHIYAQNSDDAYFAIGYVNAQDRLFQMEMLRRAAVGSLSEVLVSDLIKVDTLFRTLGLNKLAEKNALECLSGDTTA